MELDGRGRFLKYAGLLSLLPTLFFQGCEEKKVYSRFTDGEVWQKPECIRLPDTVYSTLIEKQLEEAGYPVSRSCPNELELFIGKSACPPEKGGSVGFVRLQLLNNKKEHYRIQAEFWQGEQEQTVELLLGKMVEEFTFR